MNLKVLNLINKCIRAALDYDMSKFTIQIRWDRDLENYRFTLVNDYIVILGYGDGDDAYITSTRPLENDVDLTMGD